MIKGKKILLNQKPKKGFTLVELIAVIIIIGVILLIIIPNVTNTIQKAEERTFTSSAKGVIRAANDYFADEEFSVNEGDCISATSGSIEFDKDYQITGGNICYINGRTYLKRVTNGKYCATGNADNLSVTLCDKTIEISFNIEDALSSYYGYMNSINDNVFVTNENDFVVLNELVYNTDNFTVELEKGETLRDYIADYQRTGLVSYYYSGNYYEDYLTYYSFWTITDWSGGYCTSYVPAIWDRVIDIDEEITSSRTYNVVAIGTINCGGYPTSSSSSSSSSSWDY